MNSQSICIADVLLEFFEVCFHSILFLRNVYPPSIFVLKKKYNVPVHVCLYPDLNQYISQVLKSIKKFLISNKIEEISFCIYNSSSKLMEKFVFNNIHFGFEPSLKLTDELLQDIKQLEDAFRTFCLKLSMMDSVLKPPQDNSSFRIFVKTEESGYSSICDDPSFEEFPWIAEDIEPNNMLQEIVPIKSIQNPSIQLQLYAKI
ncbi:mitotic spindle assembly checkpoint protein MAD2B [Macrosteles quadrilineatus]|uniref:mitotic spindle assembly checkpoint protein MAD2B n=1 Tax=Macrosteles quadrilineatus TaxID=74068 RepID=UPI0023E0E5EF|nr:mitotic spindle assembly checkpoint protein MAD2B [Macrosteles quadrilineatus]